MSSTTSNRKFHRKQTGTETPIKEIAMNDDGNWETIRQNALVINVRSVDNRGRLIEETQK